MNTNSIAMWVILQSSEDWDCFKTPILREILKIRNPLLEEHGEFLESHTFVPTVGMCKKQTAVSHSSTESEIISLETGLRLDGLPALELRDLIVSVFGSMTQTTERTERPVDTERRQQSQGEINVLNNIDSVPSNVQSSRQEALLYVFEDNEAVIKTIIKGRSPTMRHVSRTHRVALDWPFDRLNLNPEIQIKCVDTKHQLADVLKNNLTRDEWINFLYLFYVSHISLLCRSSEFLLDQPHQNDGEKDARTGRRQQDDDDEPGHHCLDKFFDCAESSCVEKPRGYSKHPVEQIGQAQRNLTQEIPITTQRRVLKDGKKMQFWIEVRGNSSLQETQRLPAVTKLGHTVSIIQQITCCTWRRFSSS